MSNFNLYDSVIALRAIMERVEELESEIVGYAEKMDDWQTNADNAEELETLQSILDELKDYGWDEQWRGDWYPLILIRDSYFTEYAQELVKDCAGLPRDIPSYIEIDWDATANNLKVDYSCVDIDGTKYLYR